MKRLLKKTLGELLRLLARKTQRERRKQLRKKGEVR